MKIEFRPISIFTVMDILGEQYTAAEVDLVTNKILVLTTVLNTAVYGEDMLCIYGLIPRTILSDEAYIWMHWTSEVEKHKLIFARRAKRLVNELLHSYSIIRGHCFIAGSMPWLMSVGATFHTPTEFSISR